MYVFWRWVFQARFSIQVSVHLFLTAFSVFGSWINFIKILISCFFQFTPFCPDLWKLFHPLMSEPNIPVHPNKQVFWQTIPLLWFCFWLSEWVKTPADLSFSGAQSCEDDKDWYSKKMGLIIPTVTLLVVGSWSKHKALFLSSICWHHPHNQKQVISCHGKNENEWKMSKNEKCLCIVCKTLVLHTMQIKFCHILVLVVIMVA